MNFDSTWLKTASFGLPRQLRALGTGLGLVAALSFAAGCGDDGPSAVGDGGTDSGVGGGPGTCTTADCMAVLLKDIAADAAEPSPDASPEGYTAVGSTTYFFASDRLNGLELWKTDGSAGGTQLVKDLAPGAASTTYGTVVAGQDVLWFTLSDGVHGFELWKSDGTAAGTVLVKDIYPGSDSATPTWLTAVGAQLFFSAIDPTDDTRRLFVSDGSAEGTFSLPVTSPTDLVAMGGKLYFSSWNASISDPPAINFGLWTSDGTPTGTVNIEGTPIVDATVGTDRTLPRHLFVHEGRLYFVGRAYNGTGTTLAALWSSDGNPDGSGTEAITGNTLTFYITSRWASVGQDLYTAQTTAASGNELWRIVPGTPGSATRISEIAATTASSTPHDFAVLGGKLYFAASTVANDTDLWSASGASVTKVKDFGLNAYGGGLRAFGSKLYFTASNAAAGMELWESDGTDAGTILMKDIWTGANPSDISEITVGSGSLLFTADDDVNGLEVWKSDGTAAGTALLTNINIDHRSSNPANLVEMGGSVYFAAGDSPSGSISNRELWKTDGTAAGTVLVKDIYAGANDSSPAHITAIDGLLYFAATDGTSGIEPYVSDGTAAGTRLLKNINTAGADSNPHSFIKVGETIYFVATSPASGEELWTTDGTEAGTVQLKDINPTALSSSPSNLFDFNGTLVFTATESLGGRELWKSDGTAAGTVQVKDIDPGVEDSNPTQFLIFQDQLFFTAVDSTTGSELYRSDLTSAGTVLVHDINTTVNTGSDPAYMVIWNDTLYFAATDATNGRELYSSNGTTASLVRNIYTGAPSSNPTELTVSGNSLFFQATTDTDGAELWKTDGTTAGTVRVKDIVPGTDSSNPAGLVDIDGTLVFAAYTEATGVELWTSDGTEAGTALLADAWEGPWNGFQSYHSAPAADGSYASPLLFAATNGNDGVELWRTNATTGGTVMLQDIAVGASSSSVAVALHTSDRLFLVVDNGKTGAELWSIRTRDL